MGAGKLGGQDLSPDWEDFHRMATQAFGRRRVSNEAGEFAEGQPVRDFECPGICASSVSHRSLLEGFKQISNGSVSVLLEGPHLWEKLMLML